MITGVKSGKIASRGFFGNYRRSRAGRVVARRSEHYGLGRRFLGVVAVSGFDLVECAAAREQVAVGAGCFSSSVDFMMAGCRDRCLNLRLMFLSRHCDR